MALPIDFTPPPLSEEEIRAQLFAQGLPTAGPEYQAYLRYIRGVYNDMITEMTDAEYESILAAMQRRPPQAVLDAIVDRAASNAKDLITNVSAAELTKIQQQIADATAQGKGPEDVARQLDEVKGLDSNRAKAYENYKRELEESDLSDAEIERRLESRYQKLLRDRRDTIAKTEMRKGTSQINRIEAEARGARFKVWQTSGDARVSDECQANEAQGPLRIGEGFTSGADWPPQHPNCRCTVSYLTNPALLDDWRNRAEQRAAETAAAKDSDI